MFCNILFSLTCQVRKERVRESDAKRFKGPNIVERAILKTDCTGPQKLLILMISGLASPIALWFHKAHRPIRRNTRESFVTNFMAF